MSDWFAISEVEPAHRRRFVNLAEAQAIRVRSKIYAEDRINSEALHKMQTEYIASFNREYEGHDASDVQAKFSKGLASLPDLAPIERFEEVNKSLPSWLWPSIIADETVWEDCQFVMTGRFNVVFAGLEAASSDADRFGIGRSAAGVKPLVKSRKLRGNWPEWIASAVWLAADGKIHGGVTQTELLDMIADDLANMGNDGVARATAQPSADAILTRFRNEGVFS